MDNQWYGTAKQWLGVLTAPFYVRPLFDAAFVSGERQAIFARKLGFEDERIWRGNLAPDVDAYAEASNRFGMAQRQGFLYAGRLSSEKGIDTLLEAYRLYRQRSDHLWPLRIVGSGPLSDLIVNQPGVEALGFVQPVDLPKIYAQSKGFIVPSRWEPWGVVIQEACAAGLPIICTTACGASVHFVQDGYNGFTVSKDKPDLLASAMVALSETSESEYKAMAQASFSLSRQFTPERWSRYVLRKGDELLRTLHP